ncbi:MAG: phosphoribosyltransferase family protein [Gammaproteobacteria bacterium]|nr:phosphoribosyltransferase family protein [Gammaproteobacteria bacterium]
MVTDKQYISAQQLLEDSFRLGAQILNSGFRPNFIVGVWRGGSPVGIAVQELLYYFGVQSDHISIRTSSYTGIGERTAHVRVHGLSYMIRNVNAEDALLIVDDVYDSGLSIEAIIETIHLKARRNAPQDIRVATAYFKPGNNRTEREPDYYVHNTDNWLVFPHELDGLSIEEIVENKPGMRALLDELPATQKSARG